MDQEIHGMDQKTHGMSRTKIYKVWNNIGYRCNNSNHPGYKNYGGRGIKCEWNNFEEFYKDMGYTYKEGLTIDRENNNGNYCKSNCSWVTKKEQARNRRSNKLYKGKCIAEWCEIQGLSKHTVYSRIKTYGRDIKKALELI